LTHANNQEKRLSFEKNMETNTLDLVEVGRRGKLFFIHAFLTLLQLIPTPSSHVSQHRDNGCLPSFSVFLPSAQQAEALLILEAELHGSYSKITKTASVLFFLFS
jgi:hypothetical protein